MSKKNYNYGKIENSKLVYAPMFVHATVQDEEGNDVNVNIYNPSDYYYRLNGYKAVVRDPYPQDGKTYTQNITEDEQNIVIGWRQIITPPEPPSTDERLEAAESAILDLAELIGGLM